jgi:hypothetical protein
MRDRDRAQDVHLQLARARERAAGVAAQRGPNTQTGVRVRETLREEAPARGLEHVTSAPGFATAIYGPLAVAMWDGLLSPSSVRMVRVTLDALAKTETRILFLVVLGAKTPAIDVPLRRSMHEAIGRIGWQTAAVAEVIEGGSYRATTMQGVALTPNGAMAQCGAPNVHDAASFLASYSDKRVNESEIESAVRNLRSRIGR